MHVLVLVSSTKSVAAISPAGSLPPPEHCCAEASNAAAAASKSI